MGTIIGTQGQTANCKDLEHGKALISSIVFTVSSGGVPAPAIADVFLAGAAGGGAGGGLSAGAIVGIVLGSVAGGVILLGVTGILIAAAVLAAVMISRRSDSEDEEAQPSPPGSATESRQPSPKTRPALRRTLQNLFGNGGGVDVMNNPHQKPGHTSITARTPARFDD